MKKNLKLLVFSAFVALIFASPQAMHGMEDFIDRINTRVNNVLSRFVHGVSSGSDITREIRENPFEPKKCPEEIRFNILERAAIDNCFSYDNTGSLGLVCKDWWRIIEQDRMKKAIENTIYQRFLNGVLIYRPNQGSDAGMVALPIRELTNPLEGAFDLSKCGDTGKYFSISTGYRKRKKQENALKAEIWFAPRFLVEKEINGSASHFKAIFPKRWPATAPVGIFWTWGGWDELTYYHYLTTENMENLSKIDLYENWQNARGSRGIGRWHQPHERVGEFHVSFVN